MGKRIINLQELLNHNVCLVAQRHWPSSTGVCFHLYCFELTNLSKYHRGRADTRGTQEVSDKVGRAEVGGYCEHQTPVGPVKRDPLIGLRKRA